MPRPRLRRRLRFRPKANYYKPQGIPMRQLEEIILSKEELEALKLKDYDLLDQTAAAEKMNTSQSTFQRILVSARRKVAEALIEGKAVRMDQ